MLTDKQIDAAYREVWSTIAHAHRLTAFAHLIEAEVRKEIAAAQPVRAESKPCFMCHGQGWHYIAHAYPPGVTVPKLKIACTQCVAQPVQPDDGKDSEISGLKNKSAHTRC